jgi:hypothetical protein
MGRRDTSRQQLKIISKEYHKNMVHQQHQERRMLTTTETGRVASNKNASNKDVSNKDASKAGAPVSTGK